MAQSSISTWIIEVGPWVMTPHDSRMISYGCTRYRGASIIDMSFPYARSPHPDSLHPPHLHHRERQRQARLYISPLSCRIIMYYYVLLSIVMYYCIMYYYVL